MKLKNGILVKTETKIVVTEEVPVSILRTVMFIGDFARVGGLARTGIERADPSSSYFLVDLFEESRGVVIAHNGKTEWNGTFVRPIGHIAQFTVKDYPHSWVTVPREIRTMFKYYVP